jgi:O-antigen/teichoic acid export membrane protein
LNTNVGRPIIAILAGLLPTLQARGATQKMWATGRPLLVSSAAINIVVGVVLVAKFGLTGAAIATTITLAVWNLAMARFITRHLRLAPGVLDIFRRHRGHANVNFGT